MLCQVITLVFLLNPTTVTTVSLDFINETTRAGVIALNLIQTTTTTAMFRLLPQTRASSRVIKDREEIIAESHQNTIPKRASLAGLPTELHLLIAAHLTYPDALSLKFTSRHFFYLVDTGVNLKVAWLMERRSLHLECPNDKRCDLGSDLRFCRGSVKYVYPPFFLISLFFFAFFLC